MPATHSSTRRWIQYAYTILPFMLAGLCGCPSTQPPDPAVRYIAFGDSSTQGPAERDYPAILGELLDVPADAVALEGRHGETAAEGLDRLRQMLSRDTYPNAHTLLYWQGATAIIDFIEEQDPFLIYSPMDADYPYPSELDALLDDIQADIESAIDQAHDAGLTVYIANYFKGREVLQPCDPLLLNIILPN